MKTWIDNALKNIGACIKEKPNNVMMSLWLKRIMCFATIWSMYYSFRLGSYSSARLFMIALVVWFVDSIVTTRGVFLYLDVVCLTIVSGVVDSVFMSGEIGFPSCFICITIGVIAIFILGLFWGNLISLLNFVFIIILLNMDSLDWIREAYSLKFAERFPFIMISFLATANFIVYGMNKYVISQRNYRATLNDLIAKGKRDRSAVSLKILVTMHKAMAAKSPTMTEHAEVTAEWTNKIAIEMGLHSGAKKRYYYAGLLHDIGKIGLPDEFWDKTELTDEEYEIYKTHVDIGNSIVGKLRLDEISDAALYHHEKWKGNGYKGLRGNEIPETARIVAIANFIARLKQKGLTYEEIKAELIAEGGKAYDIRIVEIAAKLIDEVIIEEEEKAVFGEMG